ncbi:MAG TPA: Holliday junction branch migration DNA helicase RuvB [Candidatus Rifleibacterium sp.]|nr:Holliday junction branch migration DNA helicase RuvB [Candidatus Rifleibacterium sp.]HPT47967.1 Holliday junction branch migration DNA helicase RuvB [Candidatus Rifleibacterium sp.]
MRKKNLRDEAEELLAADQIETDEDLESESILARTPLPGDEEILLPSLRPRQFNEFIGQSAIVEKLRVFIAAARERGEPLDHTLLLGPPGLGKTTLANVIATEMGVQIRITSGPVLNRAGDVAALLTGLRQGDVLFIDEIHRLSKNVEEVLYPAMEDYHFDVLIGKGPTARSLRMKVQPFTLIGATTREGDVSAPLRTRFGVVSRIDYYSIGELTRLIESVSARLQYPVSPEAAGEIARRARGTPRVAIRMFKRMRDVAQVNKCQTVDLATVETGMQMLQVDRMGLDYIDRKILDILLRRFDGGPVSLDTLAVSVGEEADTIYDVYESFLIQIGFIARTSRGRIATRAAWEYFGMRPPEPPVTQNQLKFDE